MPHFEDDALARRQLTQDLGDPLPNLPAVETPLRIEIRSLLPQHVHAVDGAVDARKHCRLLFADLAFSQVIQTEIGGDPVYPGVKAAIETERGKTAVNP